MRSSAEGASFDRHQSAPDYARGAGLCLTSSLPPAHMVCTKGRHSATRRLPPTPAVLKSTGTGVPGPLVSDSGSGRDRRSPAADGGEFDANTVIGEYSRY